MPDQNELIDLLDRSAYLDEVIHDFRDNRDPLVLQMLLDDPGYSGILINKFFYPDRESLLYDVEDFSRLDEHISQVTGGLNCWFNCIRRSFSHRTDKIRFLFVFSGRCVCRQGPRSLQLSSGDTCIVPAGLDFSHEGLGADCRLIHALVGVDYFRRTLMSKLPATGAVPTQFFQSILDGSQRCVQVVHEPDAGNCRDFLLRALYENTRKRMYYYEAVDSCLALFITELLRGLTASAELDRFSRTTDDKRLLDIRRYIAANCGTVTLAGTAEHFHFTPNYLSQFVSRKAGKTYTELVREARMQEALRLLLHTTLTVSEIVNTCGYQNASYFYRIFSEQMGCTPAAYRRKNYGMEAGSPITDNTRPEL